ncbi:MAG: hypothetical protein QMC77_08985, partial [Methanocellales archaeon]|nr:hypothetical protein [Methanocellales archaeon]
MCNFFRGEIKSPLRLTADKREIKDFPKPSPLSRKQRLKDRNMIIEDFSGLEIKLKYIEGWASFIR